MQKEEEDGEFHTQTASYRHLPFVAGIMQPLALLLSIFAFISPSWLAYEAPRQIIVVETANTTNATLGPQKEQLEELKRWLFLRQNTTLETVVGNITIEGNVTLVNTTVTNVAPVFATGPPKNGLLWMSTLFICVCTIWCCWNLWRRIRVGSNRVDLQLEKLGVSSSLIGPEQEQQVISATNVVIHLSGFTGAASLLLTLLYQWATPIKGKLGWTYSDGYYNCMQSGILLLASCVLFWLDRMWNGDGFCRLGSGLTSVQTRCLLSIAVVITYMTIVATLFVALEGWHYRDSMFWTITTFTTIGFGAGVSPTSSIARLSLIPISVMGIALVGFTVSSIAQVIDEATKEGIRIEWTEVRKNRGDDGALYQTLGAPSPQSSSWWPFKKTSSQDVEMAASADSPAADVSTEQSSAETVAEAVTEPEKERELRARHLSHDMAMAGVLLLVFWLSASLTFAIVEKWSWDQSLYFVFIAMSTVGYGDVVPATPQGLAIFNIFIFVAIGIVTWCASVVAMWYGQAGDATEEAIKACGVLEKRLLDASRPELIQHLEEIQLALTAG